MGYTLAFFGETDLNKNLVFDALADHFRLGPPDGDGYYVYLPETQVDGVELIVAVDTAAGVKALDPINEWSARAGLSYTLVTRTGLRAADLAHDAGRIVTSPDVPERVAAIISEALTERGQDVGLAVFCARDAVDESAARLIELVGEKVSVYCVGDGMLPLDQRTPGEITAEEFDEALEAGEAVSVVFSPGPDYTAGQDAAFLDELAQGIDAAQARSDEDFDHLRKLIDGARSGRAGESEELPVDESGQYMLPLPDEQDPAEIEREFAESTERVVTAPPARKRTAAKTRREWLDPETGEWKPIGRGRPRNNVEIREVEA